MSRIAIGNEQHRSDWLTDPLNHVAQNVLRRAYESKQHPKCDCQAFGVPMYIAASRAKQRYYLKRTPDAMVEHALNCPLYNDPQAGSRISGLLGINQGNDGSIHVQLPGLLSRQKNEGGALPASSDIANYAPANAQRIQTSISMIGLLQFLWEQVRLNQWYSNRQYPRSWNTVHHLIDDYLTDAPIIINGKQSLQESLTVIKKPITPSKPVDGYPAVTVNGLSPTTASFILGELLFIGEAKGGGFNIKLKFMHGMQNFYLHGSLANRLFSNFGRELAAFSRPDKNKYCFVVLVKVFKFNASQRNMRMLISDMAIMMTTRHFIPIESNHEEVMAGKLIAEGRRFVKPLIHRAGAVLPDFVLLDTPKPVYVEIFGMSTQAYLKKKAEKIAFYKRSKLDTLLWDTVKLPNPPKLPDESTDPETVNPDKMEFTFPAGLMSLDKMMAMALWTSDGIHVK
ncbi:MAG: DUF1173 family protein [Thiotrichales bacterium]|jgi:hypothetical protein|nr:DUF1173 family protein [Thiotrichales bacterium]